MRRFSTPLLYRIKLKTLVFGLFKPKNTVIIAGRFSVFAETNVKNKQQLVYNTKNIIVAFCDIVPASCLANSYG